ncbi:hypothetical protein EU805_11050 [Salipiger sp. IMCC34102]|uniref:hypothetical protein n=1 Tax=Salipiger sp. IMCC34102 TaxID=2510647 RepID=UPI00101E1AC6|nr:hypothetical protein [Salipiger sp. IMCC34102]RYH02377.1 hypothetical protein EU805_11050 [Salipiger sp. IMCC34102]
MRLAALLLLAALPARADPVTAEAFAAHVTGRTLAFTGPDGEIFGVERYGPDRQVLWSATPGTCQTGTWFARDDEICFTYDTDPWPKCWDVALTDDGLRVTSTLTGLTLVEAQDTAPLVCDDPLLLSRF